MIKVQKEKSTEIRHPSDTFKMAELMDKNRLAAARMRARYLFESIDYWMTWDEELARIWIDKAFDELDYLLKNIRPPRVSDNTVTEEMIERARNYHIDQLIDFKKNKAIAFCHNDQHPSLHWNKKTNTATCYACNITFDSIQVLRSRDNIPFHEAVRRLL